MALAEQNPEEFCLIKCTKITTGASTNNTDNNCVDTNSQEDEKRQEVSNFASDVVEEIKTINEEQVTKEPAQTVAEIFKQRLTDNQRAMKKSMAFADQMDFRCPQLASEFANEIYSNMRKEEERLKVDPSYLTIMQNPKEVKDTSRAFLVEWIIDVHRKFRLVPETLYVTVFLVDRFLSLKQIRKNQLHILGVTSLLISTKYEEIYPPELKDLL